MALYPAAPPGPQKAAAMAWNDAYEALTKEADKWAARTAAGKPPLKAGELAKLQSFIQSVQAMYPMGADEAAMASAAMQTVTKYAANALNSAVDAIPEHVVKSAAAQAAAIGFTNIPNQAAIAAIVNGQVGQLTADFAYLTGATQQKLIDALVGAVAAGEGPYEAAKRFKEALGPTIGSTQARSVMIARTTLARAYDQASLSVYSAAGQAGILYGWRWEARSGSCDLCRSLHSMVFPPDMDTYRHPNCTCAMVPVLPDEAAANKAFGQRHDGFSGTSTEGLELVTSDSGWSQWNKVKPGSTSKGLPYKKAIEEQIGGKLPSQAAAKAAQIAYKAAQAKGTAAPSPKAKALDDLLNGKKVDAPDVSPVPDTKWVAQQLKDFDTDIDYGKWDYSQTGSTKMWMKKDGKTTVAEVDGKPYYWNHITNTWSASDGTTAPSSVMKALDKALANFKPVDSNPLFEQAVKAAAKPDVPEVIKHNGKTVHVQTVNGKAYGQVGSTTYYKNSSGQWISNGSGKVAQKPVSEALEKALKAKGGQPGVSVPGAVKTGKAPGKAGEAIVKQDAKGALKGTYGGDDFWHDGINWIHGPTGSAAGPNSTSALNAAMKAGGMKPPAGPKTPGLPDWIKEQGKAPDMTPDEINQALHDKLVDRDKTPSPIQGVTNQAWHDAWDKAADGHKLPTSIYNHPGASKIVAGFYKYTHKFDAAKQRYDKSGFRNKAAQEWFKHAPRYQRQTWRGMNMRSEQGLAQYLRANKPGSHLDLEDGSGFSFSEATAESFSGRTRYSVVIEVRGGTSGLPLRGFSQYASENEILVNSRLEVIEVRDMGKNGVRIIVKEVAKYGGRF